MIGSDVAPTVETPPVPRGAADSRAPWWHRAAALAVDTLPAIAVLAAVELVRLAVPADSPWYWVCAAVEGATILGAAANRVLLPTITGWTLGRAVTGITVRRSDGTPIGPWRLLLRDVAHLLDTASACVGWLWPLWDQRNRTFADLVTGTEVHRVAGRPPGGRLPVLARVFLFAALTCLLAAALGCLVVYQRDRAVEAARADLGARGPKMVEQLLSYRPDSLPEDFARAQSLATDSYRAQLVEQQQQVRTAGVVPNEYWAVNSAVLPGVQPARAQLLVFLQGQRGEKGSEQFLSATVRVDFAKTGTQWRIDDLAVVTKPVSGGAGS